MKPMIKYRGGKSKEIPHILWYIPRFSGRYIEPFFGGGAVFFDQEPEQSIINDINEPLITFYQQVAELYPQLMDELTELHNIYELNENLTSFKYPIIFSCPNAAPIRIPARALDFENV